MKKQSNPGPPDGVTRPAPPPAPPKKASSGNSDLLSDLGTLLLKWVETLERNQRFEKEQESVAAGIMAGAQAGQILDVHFLLEKYR